MALIPNDLDIEASPAEDVKVPDEVVLHDFMALHGEGWDEVPAEPDRSDPMMLSLEQWLGADLARSLSVKELEALRLSVGRLPEPEAPDSFVWNTIQRPDDVPVVAEAIVGYRRFDPAMVAVSEALGGNGHFRKFAKALRVEDTDRLEEHVDREIAAAAAMKEFMARMENAAVALKSVFGDREFTIAAALVAFGAAGAIAQAQHHYSSGFDISHDVSDEDLEALDGLRRKAVGAADAVKKACRVDPLLYSRNVLGGVRRSIAEKRAGDFVFAIEALGGKMETRERIQDAGRAFAIYLTAIDAFAAAAESFGVDPAQERALLARLLVRRHLRSAARKINVEWDTVREELELRPGLDPEAVRGFLESLDDPGLSGRLVAVCRDLSRKLVDVSQAAYRTATTREYVIEGGRRATEANKDITVGEVRRVIDGEPSLEEIREVLRTFGAVSRTDVEQLERHLEWMISAYALPVTDEAVVRIVETKAEIIPLRLAQAA